MKRDTNFLQATLVVVGLIEQSNRSDGDGFPVRLSSTRPPGLVPVGSTEGESL